MERSPVKSSFLAAIGYDTQTKILEVEFKSGRIYQYLGVEPGSHAGLVGAESVGNFYSRFIANKFESRRAHELEAAPAAPDPEAA
jgi:hypothetical protein